VAVSCSFLFVKITFSLGDHQVNNSFMFGDISIWWPQGGLFLFVRNTFGIGGH
jgi:hypothetical protein